MPRNKVLYPKSSCCIFFICYLLTHKEITADELKNKLKISRFEISRYKKEINDTLLIHNLHIKIGLIYYDSKEKKYILMKGE